MLFLNVARRGAARKGGWIQVMDGSKLRVDQYREGWMKAGSNAAQLAP
jgi:hypothetical protein